MKLEHTRSELKMARVEVDAWKRARAQKDAILRRSAARRLQRWVNMYGSRARLAWDKWVSWNNCQRMIELAELHDQVVEARRLKRRVSELEGMVDRGRQDCARLQGELEAWSIKARVCEEELEMFQSREVVDRHTHERCVSEKEHWELIAKQKVQELEALRGAFSRQKEQWTRRFSTQQDMIERLESDVEELSELKVLELAENYYDSVTM